MIVDPVEGLVVGLLSIIFIGCILWIAMKLRKALHTMGEVLAKQSEQKEWGPPDPGNPHEDTQANRDEDPR